LLKSGWLRYGEFVTQRITLPRYEVAVFVVIVAVASFIRLWDLGQVGFNNDEAVYSGQAAALAGYEEFSKHFSIFRAHPLLLQFAVSGMYGLAGVSDVVARIVPAVFGVMTIIVVYFIGRMFYNSRVAIISASVLALLPYHIIMTRQVMVDVPFSFFFVLTLFFMAKYVATNNRLWVYGVGASAGLSFLSKEVGILTLIVSLLYMLLTRKLGIKNLVLVISSFLLAISPHLTLILTRQDAMEATTLYTLWQLARSPNYPIIFYPEILLENILGYVLSALIIIAIIYAIRARTIRTEQPIKLLLTWIFVPFVFFMLYPLKGYYFLVALVPPSVLLGTSFLTSSWWTRIPHYKIVAIALIPLIVLSTHYTLDYLIFPGASPRILAGSGGIPYAGEAAIWIKENVPQDAVFLTIHSSIANIIKFYSNHDALSMNVNPNPGRHNPSYTPILNIDLMILTGQIQYLVYDVYSGEISANVQEKTQDLLYYIDKYDARAIHTEYGAFRSADGKIETKPAVIVYRIDNL
jgi:hypothetical protein